TAVAWLGRVLRSSLSWRERLDLVFYLTGNLNYLLLWVLVLAVPPAVLLRIGSAGRWLWADVPFFGFATLSVALFYGRALSSRRSPMRTYLWTIPHLMALGLGMTVHNTRAVLRGAFGRSRVFERTPKRGSTDGRRRRIGLVGWAEAGMTAYVLAAIAATLRGGQPLSLPLLALFAYGYAMVFRWSIAGIPSPGGHFWRRTLAPGESVP
ncbi:MAG: hypothetical protein KDC38_00865, partial [Planctomycetes bacterium]|nr:hypothetical protein [Planctomycetota bacterium]